MFYKLIILLIMVSFLCGISYANTKNEIILRSKGVNIPIFWLNSKTILISKNDKTGKNIQVCTLNINTKKLRCLVELKNMVNDIYIVSLLIDNNWLYIVASFEGCRNIFKVNVNEWDSIKYKIKNHNDIVSADPINGECFDGIYIADGKHFITHDFPPSILVVKKGKTIMRIDHSSTPFYYKGFLYFTKHFALSEKKSKYKVGKMKDGSMLKEFLFESSEYNYEIISTSTEGLLVISKYNEKKNELFIYDIDTGKKINIRKIHNEDGKDNIVEMSISPDGERIIYVKKTSISEGAKTQWTAILSTAKNLLNLGSDQQN